MKSVVSVVAVMLLAATAVLGGGGGEEKQLDQLCSADEETVKLYEAFVKPTRECMAELQPHFTEALSKCNKKVFGTDPQTAADAKKTFCPKNQEKMKKLGECLEREGCTKPSDDERKEAKKKMNECLGKKAGA